MITLLLTILGLCFGSFVNATAWRLHEQSLPKKKRVASDKALSISKGRSMCTHCKHELGVWDLIPLFSWLFLRGKCRYCGHKIDDNPLVELIVPVLFVVSYLFWPVPFDAAGVVSFVVWLLALIGLSILVVYDIRWMLLPDRVVLPLSLLGVAGVVANAVLSTASSAGGILAGSLESIAIAGGLFFVLFQVSKGKWIGGGDVKLGFVIGLLLMEPGKSVVMLFMASFIGTLIVAPLLVVKKLTRRSHVPFGPFLILGTIVAQLFGASLLHWYTAMLLGNSL